MLSKKAPDKTVSFNGIRERRSVSVGRNQDERSVSDVYSWYFVGQVLAWIGQVSLYFAASWKIGDFAFLNAHKLPSDAYRSWVRFFVMETILLQNEAGQKKTKKAGTEGWKMSRKRKKAQLDDNLGRWEAVVWFLSLTGKCCGFLQVELFQCDKWDNRWRTTKRSPWLNYSFSGWSCLSQGRRGRQTKGCICAY